ncbi:hypothetical protein GO495_31040 [Chitinophaga oryziterrae]|uniref:Uncharacterized protein n=1 Tax=Chitinophaga oryziterrae TaxID=1031224 RepID=A0A6N8JJB3_9BACT|nr:hypothetical protein [Chitinophaga oryziterrae]MVT45064.1 hypothetical protein [Chitinophaga oryziterrae]
MLDQDFCSFLEYKICSAFEDANNVNTKSFWCDGVLLSESAKCYSQKYVNDNRQVKLKAFIGKSEQTEYELTLKFGNNALSKYASNSDIQECIPNTAVEKWFFIDIEKRKIEIQLD